MKKLMLIAVIVGFAFATNAQTTTKKSKKEKSKTEQTATKYECPKCHIKSGKAGNCAGCEVAMKEVKTDKMPMKDHICITACKDGKHVYAHGEKGDVCRKECKKMTN